jgi:reactive intermediate/imine deaminase
MTRHPGRTAAAAAVAITLLAGCAARQAPPAGATGTATYHTPYGRPVYPFSPAVQVGSMLYLAGQIGTDSTNQLVPGGIEAETRRTMDNIADILARTGSSMDRVVKCTVMMADMAEWPAMNAIYRTYFRDNYPARSAFGTNGLALGARVEIECWATVGPR